MKKTKTKLRTQYLKVEGTASALSLMFSLISLYSLFVRKPPVVTKTGKRRVQLAKGAAASLLSSASKLLHLAQVKHTSKIY